MTPADRVGLLVRATRISVRDRAWRGTEVFRVLGPLRGPSLEQLRRSLVGWHGREPGRRALCRMDDEHWVPRRTAEFAWALSGLVSTVPDPAPGGPGAVVEWLRSQPLEDRPMLLAVGQGYLGLKASHALGDGYTVDALLPAVLRGALTGEPVPAAQRTRLALARAAAHQFGRHPTRLPGALRPGRPRHAAPDPAEWKPAPSYQAARSGPATLARLRKFRDLWLPGVSSTAILFAAGYAALAQCGLPPPAPGLVVLVNARRYLPALSTVEGNFSWGQYLRPTDPGDPRTVHAALRAELAGGRALAMLALRDGQLLLPHRAGAPPRAAGRPRLTVTHLGRLDGYRALPWVGPPDGYRLITAPAPDGPDGITLAFAELAGALHVSAGFHGSTFDPLLVARAVELLSEFPVELVEDWPAATTALIVPGSG